ncbi:NRDE family protein [Sphingomonas sp. BT-65]|uniref:NRDE family protein n=1 Tax=Sphingomonas sp. BT-65 TaxID=2989821 RepID=UPI0022357C73|nr:NRDE family protein [Sphingomonas sp. BT-65]MCW4462220.1 NRDE family protein [Sphingomonas sp. BT-65]
MCVLALAWHAHPDWRLVAAGNRDERHDRPAAALARWMAGGPVIAGRDLVAGGTWLGLNESGRFAAVTNVHGQVPDPAKASRGALVTDMLAGNEPADLEAFNPFNLIAVEPEGPMFLTNRPEPLHRPLGAGMHGLSNGLLDTLWPKTLRLQAGVASWLAAGGEAIEPLFAALADERPAGSPELDEPDVFEPVNSPVFIRGPVYGTRCSTVVTVDRDGRGRIAERRFHADGAPAGETVLRFRWP